MVKQLPNSLEAEQTILSLMIMNQNTVGQIIDSLFDEDFFDTRNRLIFQAIKDLYNNGSVISLTTVTNQLKDKKQFSKAGDMAYLLSVTSLVTSESHLYTYVSIVKDNSIKRQVIETAQAIADRGLTNHSLLASEFLDSAEAEIFAISQRRRSSEFNEIGPIIDKVKKTIEDARDKSEISGLRTGISKLDQLTKGFQPEELIILAARPGMGKSALAMNLAINIAKHNKGGKAGVAIFSLEMNNEQLVMRMLSHETNINNNTLKSGYLTHQDWQQFELRTQHLRSYNIFFDDSSASNLSEIRTKCRKLKQEGKLEFLIIDYLQLISEKGVNRQEQVSAISRSLKQLARELKIPVLALSQLSREIEKRSKEDRRPVLADLRESGSIEQDADIVMFLYREDVYEPELRGESHSNTELIIQKNRSGGLGSVDLLFFPEYSRFSEKEENFAS